jgi:hypothetical protein
MPMECRISAATFITRPSSLARRQSRRLAALSRPFRQVSEVAGFKTLDEGHVDVCQKHQNRMCGGPRFGECCG